MGEAHTYRRALRWTLVAMAVLAVVGTATAWATRGPDGAIAAFAGIAIAAGAGVATQYAMLVAHRQRPEIFAAIVGGAWLGKMFAIVIAVLILRDLEGFDKLPFGIAVMVGVVLTIVIDLWAVWTSRVSYASTGSGESDS